MANQTEARMTLLVDGGGLASQPVLALQSTSWYRGAAVGVLLESSGGETDVGYASKTFSGAVHLKFMGVMKRNITVPASTDAMFAVKRQLPLKKDGAVVFLASAPDITWVGQRVWFTDDQTVSLTPPTYTYPVYAGRVLGVSTMTGFTQLSTSEVLVDISDAVNMFSSHFRNTGELKVNVGDLAATGSTQANAIANAPIVKTFTIVNTANNVAGVALPTPVAGQIYIVKVATAGSTAFVYPQASGTINALSPNAGYNTAAAGSVAFIAKNATQWYTLPLAG